MAGGVYILKITDREDLSTKNIDKIVKDKMQAARLRTGFREGLQGLPG